MKNFRTYEKTGGVIDLSMVKNPLGTSPRAKQAIMKNLDKIHLYAGENEELLEVIAKQNNLKRENILITSGADGALTLIALSFFKGKKVVVPVPCFPRFEFYVKVGGGKPVFVSPKKDLNVNEEKVLSSKGEILLISSPNNPTGFSVSKEFLLSALKKFKLVVFDETLLLKENCSEDLLKRFDNLIITRSFSKLYGLAGMRIGYALASEKTINELREFSSPYPVSVLSQIAAIEAINDKNFIKKSVAFIECEKQILCKKLKLDAIKRSNSICYTINLKKIYSLRNKICVASGSDFKGLRKNYFRISIGNKNENKILADLLMERGLQKCNDVIPYD